VTSAEGEVIHIAYDDGDQELTTIHFAERATDLGAAPTNSRPAPVWQGQGPGHALSVGDRVRGNWRGRGRLYPGRVTSAEGEVIHIAYDDGDQELTTIHFAEREAPTTSNDDWGYVPYSAVRDTDLHLHVRFLELADVMQTPTVQRNAPTGRRDVPVQHIVADVPPESYGPGDLIIAPLPRDQMKPWMWDATVVEVLHHGACLKIRFADGPETFMIDACDCRSRQPYAAPPEPETRVVAAIARYQHNGRRGFLRYARGVIEQPSGGAREPATAPPLREQAPPKLPPPIPEALVAAVDPARVPNWALCPITQEVMRQPCLAADGHTYEEAAISRWIWDNAGGGAGPLSPMTGERLEHPRLAPNLGLRTAIREQLEAEAGEDKPSERYPEVDHTVVHVSTHTPAGE